MIWSLTWATRSSTTLPPKGEVSALGSNLARSACCSGVRGLLVFFWARRGAAASREPASSQTQTSGRRRVMNLSTYPVWLADRGRRIRNSLTGLLHEHDAGHGRASCRMRLCVFYSPRTVHARTDATFQQHGSEAPFRARFAR